MRDISLGSTATDTSIKYSSFSDYEARASTVLSEFRDIFLSEWIVLFW